LELGKRNEMIRLRHGLNPPSHRPLAAAKAVAREPGALEKAKIDKYVSFIRTTYGDAVIFIDRQ